MVEEGEGARTHKVKGKKNQKIFDNGGSGFSLDVTLATDPKFRAVPEQGCNTTTS